MATKLSSSASRPSESRTASPQIGSSQGQKSELRVLQVFSVLGIGGAETWLMALLRYFKEHADDLPVRVKFDVLLTGGEKGVFDDEAEALGARLFYVPFTRRTLPSFIRKFRRILGEGNYHAIHDHQDYIAGLHFMMAAGKLPRVRIAHVHNPLLHTHNYSMRKGRRFVCTLGKLTLKSHATAIMGTSRQVLEQYGFERSAYTRVELGAAYCGFDVNRFAGDRAENRREIRRELGWPPASKLVLFVGRLDSHIDPLLNQKNPAYALEIARICVERNAVYHFLFVGGGTTVAKQMVQLIASWGLEKQIHVVGQRSDVPKLMLASDLLLFPSLAEGLGMVAVEAQAAGLRVLAADTVPRESVILPDLVTFKSLHDSKSDWTDEIERLTNLPAVDNFSSNRAVRRSAFAIENSAARLLSLYAPSDGSFLKQ